MALENCEGVCDAEYTVANSVDSRLECVVVNVGGYGSRCVIRSVYQWVPDFKEKTSKPVAKNSKHMSGISFENRALALQCRE